MEFWILIMTDRDDWTWVGVPEITPVELFRIIPYGSEPDWIENDGLSPVKKGLIETS